MSQPSARCKVTNWKEYNASLVRRGDLTLWFDEAVLNQWQAIQPTGRRGRPKVYADLAVQCLLALRLLYHLPLRAAQGFMQSLLGLLECALPVPNYTTLCRRQSSLAADLGANPTDQPRHLLIDSTGLKVYGEGEWKVRQHGKSKRRTWRKLHLAIDAATQEIVAVALTEAGRADCQELPGLLLQIDGAISKVATDGAYDTWECRYAIIQKNAHAVIPPRENAVVNGNGKIEEVRQRDEAIRQIEERGLESWKVQSGYHRRSLVETAMFRVKRTFGGALRARAIQNQIAEAVLKSRILNRFIHQGMPKTVKSPA